MKKIRREHPRPQFIREGWTSLDGEWHFKFDDENIGIKNKWFVEFESQLKIQVPFTYETELSGINKQEHHSVIWYEKIAVLDNSKKYTLIFEGVDYKTQVWLNGNLLGNHEGAYSRFEFELDDYLLEGENKITVRVEDSLNCEQPRGKQRWLKDNFGCWYVQTTGIWKTVWLEEQLSSQRMDYVKITPDLDKDQIIFEPVLKKYQTELLFDIEVKYNQQLISSYRGILNHSMSPVHLETKVKDDSCWGTQTWTPESPKLYDVTFKLLNKEGELLDKINSYFGMRKISINNGQVLLNNHQLYQRLILDQGYWKESGITPPSADKLELDINRIIELGYNGVRKHQKIEDERFLYLCDEKGLLVWCEMASTYIFNDQAVGNFTNEWEKIVKQNYNHPSIITWVPFNESWGIKDIEHCKQQQSFTESIYYLTKTIDPNRPVITNDGWLHTVSDIITLHDYEEFVEGFVERYTNKEELLNGNYQFNKDFYIFAEGYEYKGQPILISEFGGIAFKTDEENDWGYGSHVENQDKFMERFEGIHSQIQAIPYVTGYCYTQLTDVEQEINGLLDVNRDPKINIQEIKKINERRIK